MKKLSKSKVNYRKHERKMFARQDRREAARQASKAMRQPERKAEG
jgi:hypothetical protein